MHESLPPGWLTRSAWEWSTRNRAVLDFVVGEFLDRGDWPHRAEIQRSLARELSPPPDLTQIFSEVPPPLGFVAPPHDRIVLTLFGLERTELGQYIVQGFVRALRRSLDIYRTGDEKPLLGWEDLAKDTLLSVKLWRAVSEVLLREAPFLGGGTGDQHGDWEREITEGIVRYWDVETPDQYLTLRAQELSASPQLGWQLPAKALPLATRPTRDGSPRPPTPPADGESPDQARRRGQAPTGIVIAAWVAMFGSGVLSFALDAPLFVTAGVVAAAVAAGVGWRHGFNWPPRRGTILVVMFVAAVAAGLVALATSAGALDSGTDRPANTRPSSR